MSGDRERIERREQKLLTGERKKITLQEEEKRRGEKRREEKRREEKRREKERKERKSERHS